MENFKCMVIWNIGFKWSKILLQGHTWHNSSVLSFILSSCSIIEFRTRCLELNLVFHIFCICLLLQSIFYRPLRIFPVHKIYFRETITFIISIANARIFVTGYFLSLVLIKHSHILTLQVPLPFFIYHYPLLTYVYIKH